MDALNEIKRWRQELHQIPELGLRLQNILKMN